MKMHFQLKVDNASEEELVEIYERLEFEFNDCQGYTRSDYTPIIAFLGSKHTFTVYDLVNWDYLEEIVVLSKEYPNAFFALYWADEYASLLEASQWVAYFKNGEIREYQAELHYPENPFRTAESQD